MKKYYYEGSTLNFEGVSGPGSRGPGSRGPGLTFTPCHNLWTICGGFSFFLITEGPILNAGPPETFLFVDHPKEDHNEREFKP